MDYLVCTLITGIGATIVVDLWGIVRQRMFAIAAPDYGLVGRWIAHMAHGRFHHESIARSSQVHGERFIGWLAHYMIGIAFAGILLSLRGIAWIEHPTMIAALIVGFGTVTAPFLLMQPGMGAGIAASATPRPAAARLQSLITHGFFGLGLYVAGWVAHYLYLPFQ